VEGGVLGGVVGGVVGGVITDTAPKIEAPLRVGGDVKAPTIITKVEPQYPEVARKARISGIVIVECTINKNGDVTDVHVLKPLPFGLDQAAVEAVRRWKFRPGTLNGQPVDVLFNLTVNFKLGLEVAKLGTLILYPPELIASVVAVIASKESRDVVHNIEVLDRIAATPAPIKLTM